MNYQALQFNPQQPQTQPVQYTLDRPPFVPQGIPVPQPLSYLLANVCSMVANEATMQMGKNCARMFTFNQLSFNGWQNSDFATVVASVFDLLLLNLSKGVYNVPEVGLQDAVGQAVTIMSCRNLAMFQGLAQMVDQRVSQEAMQVLQNASQMQNEVAMMKARASGGYNQQQGYPQSGFPQQGYPQNQFNQGVPPGFAGAPINTNPTGNGGYGRFGPQPVQNNTWQAPNNNFSAGGSSSPFNRHGSSADQQASAPSTNGDRYEYLNKNAEQFKQPVQQFQPVVPEPMLVQVKNVPQEQPQPRKELKWTNSHHQYHLPAYNTETEKLEYAELIDGNKTYVIAKVVPKGVNEVDREKHVITTAMMTHTSHIPQGFSTREAAFEKSVKDITINENPVLNAKAMVSSKALIRNFTEELMFDTRVAQKLAASENDCGVYQMNCVKATPFVATKDITEVANKLSEMTNFQNVALTMQSILNSDIDQEVKDFVFELDLMLTKQVNSVLQNKMSIDLSIDSFVDDVCDLSEYLLNSKGSSFSKAFDSLQESFIDTYLKPIADEDLIMQMRESLMDPEEGVDVELSSVFYWHSLTITSVQMHSSELKIGIGSKSSSIITNSSFPVLRNFCRKLFEAASKEDHGFAHHILVTSDNRKYELHQSAFMPDTYLISYFK